jgi:hypothetical protein
VRLSLRRLSLLCIISLPVMVTAWALPAGASVVSPSPPPIVYTGGMPSGPPLNTTSTPPPPTPPIEPTSVVVPPAIEEQLANLHLDVSRHSSQPLPVSAPPANGSSTGVTDSSSTPLVPGGPVQHSPIVIPIFLGDWSSSYEQQQMSNIETLLRGLTNSPVDYILTQYYDSSGPIHNQVTMNSPYSGSDSDTSDGGLQLIITTLIEQDGLVNTADTQWMFFTPQNVVPDYTGPSYGPHGTCAYHAYGGNDVYSMIPDTSGSTTFQNMGCEGTTAVQLHEFAESTTDPQHNGAWTIQNDPNSSADGDEVGDVCNLNTTTGSSGNPDVLLQTLFDNIQEACTVYATTTAPALTSDYRGNLDVFVRGVNNQLYHDSYNGPSNTWYGWRQDIPQPPDGIAYDPTATGKQGRLDLFVVGYNGNTYWEQDVNGALYGWTNLGGGAPTTGVGAAEQSNGTIDLFMRGVNGVLYQGSLVNNVWSGWAENAALDPGGCAPSLTCTGLVGSAPSVASWAAGRLDLVVRDAVSESVFHDYQSNGGSWGQDNQGGGTSAAPTISSSGSESLDVFVRGGYTQSPNNTLYYKSFRYPSGWSGWAVNALQPLHGITSAPSGFSGNRINVVCQQTTRSVGDVYYAGGWYRADLGGTLW